MSDSDIGIEGNSNRAAGRDYIEINVACLEQEPLAPAQRYRLNQLVKQIEKEFGADPRTLWRSIVHTRTGVSSIEDIPRGKFDVAEQALIDHAEFLHSQNHVKSLAADVIAMATQKGLENKLAKFCSREYGSEVLSKLRPEQLKAALRYVEEAPAEEVKASNKRPTQPGFFSRIVLLVNENPLHMSAVIVFAFCVGKIF